MEFGIPEMARGIALMTTTAVPETGIRRSLAPIVLVLFTTGWAANHFAAMIPLLASHEGLSTSVLNGAFGIYAIGLLPGLLFGGAISDRIGRRPVVLPGAALAGVGNLLMMLDHHELGICTGRLVVGIGAGLTFGAGTAWAADRAGRAGAAVAGVALSTGFASGPLITALVSTVGHPLAAPFAATGLCSLLVVLIASRTSSTSETPNTTAAPSPGPSDSLPTGTVRTTLRFALPMALWVFASITVPMVTLVQQLDRYQGPFVPAVAALVALGSGVIIQLVARRSGWGPRAGGIGAMLAAAGFGLAVAADANHSLVAFVATAIVLGTAYGLCLRNGLVDVETMAPAPARGLLTGVFYVVAYLGFGLPTLLTSVESITGIVFPLTVLAACAAAAGVHRMLRHPNR